MRFYQFILSLFLLSSLSAQPLSLTELVDIALQNNPETRQTWWNAQKAAAALGSADSTYYPSIGVEAHAIHGRDFKFINGPDVTYSRVGADLTLSYLLYDSGETSAKVQAAQAALLAANWQADFTMQRVMIHVLENTYAYLLAQETLSGYLDSLQDADKMLKAAHDMNQAGLSPISDVYTAQSTLSLMQLDVAQQKSRSDIELGKLAASLGYCADTPLQVAALGNPICSPMESQKISQMIALAQSQRSDFMVKQARLDEALARENAVRSMYGPKLRFAARGGADDEFHAKSKGGQYQVGLTLEIPLFTGFDAMYQNRMAYADARITEEQLNQLYIDISLEVLTYHRQVLAAQEMLHFAEEYLKNAIQAYEGTLEKYTSGKERMAEVSIAQRQLVSARLRYSEVKTSWFTSLAKLAYATGTLRLPPEVSCPACP